jgi:diacylglycerol kinase (ATP)
MSKLGEFLRLRVQSFGHAFRGWKYVIRTQPNAWIHSVITVLVVIVGFWLKLSFRDWAVLILTMALVWAAEFFNTAVESVVDLVSPQPHPLAKIAKDVAAGAVLLVAFAAILVGLLILGPPLWEKLIFLLSM